MIRNTEDNFQIALCRILTARCKCLWFHVPNGGARNAVTGAILKAMGTKPGVADLLFFPPPTATMHALELKSPKKKPRDTQRAFANEVKRMGGEYEFSDCMDDAIAILRKWGIL